MSTDDEFDLFKPVLSTDVLKKQKTTAAPPAPSVPPPNTKNRPLSKPPPRPVLRIPESQAEVDAWIAERKKRFPTQSRVAAKAQAETDRRTRGALDLSAPPKGGQKSRLPLEMFASRPTKIASFLDRLTEDEDRRHRSIVLQCFRYFTTHNFLQDDPSTRTRGDDPSAPTGGGSPEQSVE
jgi:type IV secretory pathway VirB10-like protein